LYVIIVGAGKLGFEVARRLAEEGHDVAVVDKDAARLREVEERLDVLTVLGNGASPAVLEKAGVRRADLVLAVTEVDEVNMIACMAAKQMARGPRGWPGGPAGQAAGQVAGQAAGQAAVAAHGSGPEGPGRPLCAGRIRNPDYTGSWPYTRSLRLLGVDVVIHPERLAAQEIVRLIRAPWASYVEFFVGGRVAVAAVRLAEDAPLTRGPLRELKAPCLVAACVREGELFIPDGSTRLEPGDRVYLVGRAGQLPELRVQAGAPGRTVRDVTLVGAGKVGFPLAQMLLPAVKRGLRVRVLDKDPQRCSEIADQLPGVLVLCGDAERIDVLREEGVGATDLLVAATSQDHTNLLACMIARQLGVPEVVVTVSREDYVPLAERAGADAVVVPRLMAAATALQLVHPRHVLALSILEEGQAQVLELQVDEGAPAAHRPLRDLDFAPDAVVGAVARGDQLLIPTGETVLLPGDRVLVIGLARSVGRVEALFQGRPAQGAAGSAGSAGTRVPAPAGGSR